MNENVTKESGQRNVDQLSAQFIGNQKIFTELLH